MKAGLVGTGLLVLAACAPSAGEHQIQWRLQDDVAAFEAMQPGNPEHAYRVAQLASAEESEEYRRFLGLLAEAPAADRASIYYEAASSSSHYFFAMIADQDGACRMYVSDISGAGERACESYRHIDVQSTDDPRVIRDPAVAAIAQYDAGDGPERALAVLPPDEALGMPANGDLFNKIDRIF
ncbi:MAG: hypothetical protein JNM59_04355 [Hyphomonadaceae bacterium]|nr:hypothetical protein [Hyphomonadaceae bacterium]